MEYLDSIKLPYESYRYTRRKLTSASETRLHTLAIIQSTKDIQYLSVCYSSDGKLLAAGSSDGFIRLWDAAKRELLAEAKEHDGKVWSVSFSPNGKHIVSGGADCTVRLWEVKKNHELGHSRELYKHKKQVRCVCFSPDGKAIVSGSEDHTVSLWNVKEENQREVPCGHSRTVRSVCFSPDGIILASGSDDQSISQWNTLSQQLVEEIPDTGSGNLSVCYSPNGELLASGSSGRTIRLWDAQTLGYLGDLSGHGDRVESVCFSPDNLYLASCSNDKTVCLWDLQGVCTNKPNDNRPLSILRGHSGRVNSVCFSPDGRTIASGSDDGTIRLWDAHACGLSVEEHNTDDYADGYGKRMQYLDVIASTLTTTFVKEVESYRELLELVAQISALNPRYQLFFRGQNNNWENNKFDEILYSTIWRGTTTRTLPKQRVKLCQAANQIQEAFRDYYANEPAIKLFADRLDQNPLVRWALLQHYGVRLASDEKCATPLLDVTRNLHVACTFARMNCEKKYGYVYVLALPYQREAISIDDREGMMVMSLLGVTPTTARRPLNQDGYFISESDWWRYEISDKDVDIPKNKPNFYRRVIAVFRIPAPSDKDKDKFYEGSGLSDLNREWLCPSEDDDDFAHMLTVEGMNPEFW